MTGLTTKTIAELRDGFRAGDFSAREIASDFNAAVAAGPREPVLALGVLGVLLLWASAILDGCDGELARLKLLTSRFGARFDVEVDAIDRAYVPEALT